MIKSIKKIFNFSNDKENKNRSFEIDQSTKISKRKYSTYEAYLLHQSEKLNKKFDQVVEFDRAYEQIVYERYQGVPELQGKTMICLAARLGGEVRAFKRLGVLAIGIDIEPGARNPHVVYGDFHDLQYPDNSFDLAFCNAIDHVFNLSKFLLEVKRVLKNEGIFIVEFAEVEPGEYEVLDTSDLNPILEILEQNFSVKNITPITNKSGFVNWSGKLIELVNI